MKIAIVFSDVEIIDGPDDMREAEAWADGYAAAAAEFCQHSAVDVVVLAPGWAAALRDPPLTKRILEAMQ